MKVDLNALDPSLLDDVSSTQRSATHTPGQTTDGTAALDDDAATLSVQTDRTKALVTKALESAQVQQEKIDALRQAVQNGEYKLDPATIAEAMLPTFAAAK